MNGSLHGKSLLAERSLIAFFLHGFDQLIYRGTSFHASAAFLQEDFDLLHSGYGLKGLFHVGLAVVAAHAFDYKFG
jgi:hypothetical protein